MKKASIRPLQTLDSPLPSQENVVMTAGSSLPPAQGRAERGGVRGTFERNRQVVQ